MKKYIQYLSMTVATVAVVVITIGFHSLLSDNPLFPNFNPKSNVASAVSALPTAKTLKVLVILTDFRDAPNNATSDTQASILKKMMTDSDSVNNFYKENTYGTMQIQTTVTPWIKIDDNLYTVCGPAAPGSGSTDCHLRTTAPTEENVQEWMFDATTAAEASQYRGMYNAGKYDVVYIVTPTLSEEGMLKNFIGQTFTGGILDTSGESIFINGNQVAGTYAHEMGHALGLKHFGYTDCTGPQGTGPEISQPLSGCQFDNYGHTAMGDLDYTDLSAYQKGLLSNYVHTHKYASSDFFPLSLTEPVHTTGLYTISSVETSPSSPNDYKSIYIKGTKYILSLEYRTPTGFDKVDQTDNWDSIPNGGYSKDYNNATWVNIVDPGGGFKALDDDENLAGMTGMQTDANSPEIVSNDFLHDGDKYVDPDNVDDIRIVQISHTNITDTLCITFDASTHPQNCSPTPPITSTSTPPTTPPTTPPYTPPTTPPTLPPSPTPPTTTGWVQQTGAGLNAWLGITSSADGTKLAAVAGGSVYTSSDSGIMWNETSGQSSGPIASSADGTKLVTIAPFNESTGLGEIWTSSDGGMTWVDQIGSRAANTQNPLEGGWTAVTSSSDGTKLVAVNGAYIYTSSDSGVTWIQDKPIEEWTSITSSPNGMVLIATESEGGSLGHIWTSSNEGATWTEQTSEGSHYWKSSAISANGLMMAAGDGNGGLWISSNGGTTWNETSAPQGNWVSIAMSSDGTKIAASDYGDNIYTSSDSGVTWTDQNVPAGDGHFVSITSSSNGTKLAAAAQTSNSDPVNNPHQLGSIWTDN